MAIEKQAFDVARRLARKRSAPALHPRGLVCEGTLDVPGTGDGGVPWGVPFLDRAGEYRVSVRWSRAAGLPAGWPDGLGLALRVEDAGGPGTPLDLLLTSSGTGRLGRHVPLPRRDALAGPYSTLLAYRVGGRERVIMADPAGALRPGVTPGAGAGPGAGHRRVPGDPDALRAALDRGPVRFELCAAAPDEPWRAFATLTVRTPRPHGEGAAHAYDPYLHGLPGLRPTHRLHDLRAAAYSGSRHGRGAVLKDPHDPPRPGQTTGRRGRPGTP
ncbi:phosphodiesterase [Streptomyces gobitricini]|uniref:Phosphodiesterase n=1 Tax=Streptomyces gobitricini TaxID=68211 RepID=A0ABN3LRV0_9ACTN